MSLISSLKTLVAKLRTLPFSGFVTDEKAAVNIAEAAWLPVYGERIYDTLPFVAQYIPSGGYWEVTGTLPCNRRGGVAVAHVRKRDGKIIYMSHER